ncbi:hypothetical protein KNE206_69740 [Kitasatospora sp. NE20-6]
MRGGTGPVDRLSLQIVRRTTHPHSAGDSLPKKPTRGNRKTARTLPQRRSPSTGARLPRRQQDIHPPAPEDDGAAPSSGGGWSGVREVGSSAWRKRTEDAVVVLVNEHRQKAGLTILTVDERLRVSARQHSADMAARGYFAHVSPDGSTPTDRIRAAGYPWPGAENLAKGQLTPHEVVLAWWKSPGHRKNLLHPNVRTVGVGLHLAGPEGPWWTQHFGYTA